MTTREGWCWISLDGTWHYFITSVCLCGKWGTFDRRTLRATHGAPGNCATCAARLAERRLVRGARV